MGAPKGNKYAKGNEGGRPSDYTEEIADKICVQISTTSQGLHSICKASDEFPHPDTVFAWLVAHEEFRLKYAHAREIQAELLADEIISIADDKSEDVLRNEDGEEYANTEFIQRARLRVDARKWKASKLAPKKYGDKLELDNKHSLDPDTLEVFRIAGQTINFK